MATVQFFLDNGANVYSVRKSKILDTVVDLQLDEGEWEEMNESDKYQFAEDWAQDKIEIYFKELN